MNQKKNIIALYPWVIKGLPSYPLISKGLFGKKVDSITMTTNKYLLVPVLFAHIKICVLEY